ncbi:MAG: cysteine--tRNA ligase [bacterium]
MNNFSIYNSLTKKIETIEPITPGQIGMYSCGPTVYDNVHIGNLRAFITADLLQRSLRHITGYDVKWVMNITDIDDKMIARAHDRYPDAKPEEALHELADEFTKQFLGDLAKVGVKSTDFFKQPRATDHIDEMQVIIRELLDDKIAYVADGSIYFSLENYTKSGKIYGQLADVEFDAQARIDDQDQKQGAGDFALWKAAQPGEPAWDFEVDSDNLRGRPGWHIECNAMSTKYLGHTFDIHTGGIDLKFPHHENEIAQNNGNLAHYWVHNEFLHVDSEKMSKSLGNFQTLSDIENPIAFRLLVLSSHYRKQMDFTAEALAAAQNRIASLREWVSRAINNQTKIHSATITKIREAFDQSIAADLGVSSALAFVAELEKTEMYGPEVVEFIQHLDDVLGLQLLDNQTNLRADESVMQLLSNRADVRKHKDFDRSDSIRDSLRKLGVGIEDTPHGQIIWQIA